MPTYAAEGCSNITGSFGVGFQSKEIFSVLPVTTSKLRG